MHEVLPSIERLLFYPMQAQFAQMRPPAMVAPVNPRMPMYPTGAPGLGQQIFYGQGPPAIIPPQVIFLVFLVFLLSFLVLLLLHIVLFFSSLLFT